jgi:hypothetical protein
LIALFGFVATHSSVLTNLTSLARLDQTHFYSHFTGKKAIILPLLLERFLGNSSINPETPTGRESKARRLGRIHAALRGNMSVSAKIPISTGRIDTGMIERVEIEVG